MTIKTKCCGTRGCSVTAVVADAGFFKGWVPFWFIVGISI